uniref:Uncharacterized protein n=1 Tax=Knipowitschia caucasica TaxID=637954 RepID=A0AAV2M113_KNICA
MEMNAEVMCSDPQKCLFTKGWVELPKVEIPRIKAESTSKVEGWGNDMSSSSTSPDMSVTISLFLKTGTSIQDHLHGITERHQP